VKADRLLTLNNRFDSTDFIRLTQAQINKDLMGLCDIELVLTEQHNQTSVLNQFKSSLQPLLIKLAQNSSRQLAQFIYRVDLSEDQFNTSLIKDPQLFDLAELVIEREAQKVYLRSVFKNTDNKFNRQ